MHKTCVTLKRMGNGVDWMGRAQASALKSHRNSFGHSDIRTRWKLWSSPFQKVSRSGFTWQTGICSNVVCLWRHLFQKFHNHWLPVVMKQSFFFPHMQMICLHAVMWHFITKMDSYIPQGFSGFLPEILTAFCQFMVPTSHFSTVAERQETFNHWVWFSLSPLIFSTVLPVRASAWRDKHDRNVTSPSLVLSLINRACTSQSRFLLIIIISAQKWPCTASVQIMLDFTLIKDPSSPTLFGHFLIIHLEAEGND